MKSCLNLNTKSNIMGMGMGKEMCVQFNISYINTAIAKA